MKINEFNIILMKGLAQCIYVRNALQSGWNKIISEKLVL